MISSGNVPVKLVQGANAISEFPKFGKEIIRTDSKGNQHFLTGYSYNRELFRRAALQLASMRSSQIRMDAASAAIEHELKFRDGLVIEEKRAPLLAAQLIPQDPRAGEYAEYKKYIWYKKAMTSGALVKASLNAINNEIPMVDANLEAQEESIWNVVAGYSFTVEHQMHQGPLKFDFRSEFARECRIAIERAIDDVMLNGDAAKNIFGFFNNPEVTVITPTNNDWYGGGNTPAQILAGIQEFIKPIRLGLADNSITTSDMPDTVLMSDRLYAYLNEELTFGEASDRSMMDIIKARFPWLNWMHTSELQDSGAAPGLDRMVVYKKDNRYVQAAIPVVYQEQPAVQQMMGEVIAAFGRFSPPTFMDLRPVRYVDIDIAA